MGHACGCTESSATVKEEIAHNEPKSKYQQAPSVQNKASTPYGNSAGDKEYKSKTQQQMSRLEQLVIDHQLIKVEQV